MNRKQIAIVSVMAVVVLVTAIGISRRTQAQTTNQLAGTYRMISYQRTVVATGETTEPMGKSPQGHVIYGRDGRFVMFYVADGRPTPSGLATMTDQERADLFKTMVAYSGTYKFDGKAITHHVDISFNQIWTGTNQVRNVKFEGRKLVTTTIPAPASFDGKVSVIVTTFEKVD